MKKIFVVSIICCSFVMQNYTISSFNVLPQQQEKPNDKGEREFKKLNLFDHGDMVVEFCSVRPHYSFSKNKQMQNSTTANSAEALNAPIPNRNQEEILKALDEFFNWGSSNRYNEHMFELFNNFLENPENEGCSQQWSSELFFSLRQISKLLHTLDDLNTEVKSLNKDAVVLKLTA